MTEHRAPLRHPGGHRPWNSPDAQKPLRPPATWDSPAVIALCRRCPRPDCPGDCPARKDLARTTGVMEAGLKKNIRMEDVLALYCAQPTPTLAHIARTLSVSTTTVRYWLRKAGYLPRPRGRV